MGYTHHWRREQPEIPQQRWNDALVKIRPLLETHSGMLRDVTVNGDEIFFNGSCETFYVPRVSSPASEVPRSLGDMWGFCKTGAGDYDPIVVACLVILATTLKGHPVGFTWSSDGNWPADHLGGVELAGFTPETATGPRD